LSIICLVKNQVHRHKPSILILDTLRSESKCKKINIKENPTDIFI